MSVVRLPGLRVPSGSRSRAAATDGGVRRSSNAVLIVVVVTVLAIVGLVMVLSASSVEALQQDGSPWYVFKRELLWTAIGAVGLVVAARVDYHLWQRLSRPFLVLTMVLLLAVLVPGIGVSGGGASRWIGLGSVHVQPSDLMKLAMVLFVADLLTRRAERMHDWRATVRPVLIVLVVAGALIMKQPDMGTTLIVACVTFGMLFVAGTGMRTMLVVLAGSAVGAFLLGLAQPYRRARILSFLNPWAHRSGSGYQEVQSLVGLGSGHWLGVGLGASRAKWGFLPNAHTDFIFAIIGEELGLVGSLLVVALFAGLALLGMRVAARAPDRFGSLMAAGITCWIIAQAVINVGAVIGILPVTGVPLPLVSYGGTSTVIIMLAAGILLNIASRQGETQRG